MKPAVVVPFFRAARLAASGLAAALLLTACDSTPRERQDAVKNSARKLDSVAERAGNALKRAGSRASRWDSTSRARNRQPLDTAAVTTFMQEMLGTYANVEQLTVQNMEPAYTQFLRQTRAKRREWTQRDWDYATAVFNRLNTRYRTVRLDLPARNEIRIKALQAEYEALETGRDLKDLGKAVKGKDSSAQ
jgi:gas vesicle protein